MVDPVKIVKGQETETWKTEIMCVSVCAEDLLVRKGFSKQSKHLDLKNKQITQKTKLLSWVSFIKWDD